MKTKVKAGSSKKSEEVANLCEKLDIVQDLYDKYNINYNHNTYEYDKICPVVYKKFEKEIETYKNNVIKLLNLIASDNYELKDCEEVSEYTLKEIVCDAARCIYGRCDEIEELVIKIPKLATDYIDEVIKERWEKFENNISKYPDNENIAMLIMEYCSEYKYKSEEAEKKISKFPEVAYRYAVRVKKERWIEGEASILKDIEKATEYVFDLKFRWPEYENKIKNKPKRIFEYAKKVIRGKLPDELHNRMMMKTLNNQERGHYEADEYFDWLKNKEDSIVAYMKSISPEEREVLLKKV